ncbi:MAG: hypothetical protein PF484_01090 [Bacteroidales bacterium]|jgi:hypothetical protein|nr:hypothetical protein [Bacteroidales bacterium]
MLTHEIIQLSRVPETNFRSLIQQALNHALWQYVLYFNDDEDIKHRVLSLLNESFSKLLFRFFCLQNNIAAEFDLQNGNRYLTFKLNDNNWELINLSIYDSPLEFASETTSLPAMIPAQKFDCSQIDEFGNKIIRWITPPEKQVLFTYLHNNSNKENFLHLSLPNGLGQLYKDLFKRKERGKTLKESDFWKKLKPLGTPDFIINHKPDFYITSWAGPEHWKFFYASNAQNFPKIKTHSPKNKTILLHRLPAFSRLFPQFNETLNFAKFLN